MIEYYIVYDNSTGQEVWRGSGPEGAIQVQANNLNDPTKSVIEVPSNAFQPGGATDHAAIASFYSDLIDQQAEAQRGKYITTGEGQAMTYMYKAEEAKAWTADNSAATPFMSAEATARGMTVSDLAAEILANVASWTTIGSFIEGKRMGAKKAVTDAGSNLALIAASVVIDWTMPA